MIQIGVDFGGTKIEAAALDLNGRFLSRLREPNPGSYDAAIATICRLIQKVEAQAGTQGTVGIGVPGSISPQTGLMRNANSVWLNGRVFHSDVAAALGREVRVANDANCLALSEAVDGAAAGARIAFAVILGTGCGSGLVIDGRLIEGANGLAGELGHISLPWPKADEVPAPDCWCGNKGCLETWVSGTGLSREFRAVTGRKLDAETIIQSMRRNEPDAVAAFDRFIDRLGRGLAVVSNIVDPDVFVFGGGLSNVTEIYDRLAGAIRPYLFTDVWEAKLVPARWGDSSGVRGAARLWERTL
ncbi:ROK family protein [Nitrospirillum amazonense]|uniref:Fructokinase n=1 Tax=Nitrospirillum amazonense TaxID=28077 RepID=A0A560JKR0_9PROT|nr:ROK family protein [Nitrospirillum amazonense]MDG3442797.1 ROK family protein [Nitrospirillum amazonense]TWB71793.1 fructokinase [Nitrospirillum amazonense]